MLFVIGYYIQIRRAAAVFAVTVFAPDVSGVLQIIERPLHCARREVRVAGYGFHPRPATPAACAVAEVHIDRPRPVRQVWISIDGAEEAHFSPYCASKSEPGAYTDTDLRVDTSCTVSLAADLGATAAAARGNAAANILLACVS